MGLSDWFKRGGGGRTVNLPPRGRAIVLSDLHGHYADWRAFLDASAVLDRIRSGEDLYLIITGDVPDVLRHQAVDPSVPDDGDVRILNELLEAARELDDRADRILYLEGNHDFHVVRICGEVARYHSFRDGSRSKGTRAVTSEEYRSYCDYYRDTYGQAVYENNIVPYDMAPRCTDEQLAYMASRPILAVLGNSRVLVTHAGPPRMEPWEGPALKKAIDRANREELRLAAPEEYYASPYHQLLNNRFRNGDYDLGDLSAFLAAYDASVLITGHTPHPYLVDYERQEPLEHCEFREGLGLIGGKQVVLCSSFGAFHPTWKRYLEFDLSRPYDSTDALFVNLRDTVGTIHSRPDGDDSPTEKLVRDITRRESDVSPQV